MRKNYFALILVGFINLLVLSSCEPDIKDNFFSCEQGKANQCPDGYSCVRKSEDEYRCVLNSDQFCGNGVVDDGEECDGTNIPNELNCGDGFTFCSICKTRCSECGNGVLERKLELNGIFEGEECDDGSKVDGDGCSAVCMFERAYCTPEDASNLGDKCDAWCGDGEKNGPELCDGTDLGEGSCLNQGFYGGEISCSENCQSYINTNCEGFCGDGIINGPEICDGVEYDFSSDCVDTYSGIYGGMHCDQYCRPVYEKCVRNSKIVMETGIEIFKNSMWGTGSDDLFVVGLNGEIIHYDGTSWSTMNSNTIAGLKSVWGTSSGDLFTVGAGGVIVHYNGNNWSTMSSNVAVDLESVWGSSSSNVFAVGVSGTIVRYEGSTWSEMSTPTTSLLYSVWGSDATNIFAVGASGTIIKYDGNSWNTMTSSTTETLKSVWGFSHSDIYAVGTDGTLIHYDGISWKTILTDVHTAFSSVWGSGSGDLYIGGLDVLYHFAGNKLEIIYEHSTGGFNDFIVWGTGFDNVYYFSNNFNSEIRNYKGDSFSDMYLQTPFTIDSIWGTGSDNIVITDFGSVHHFEGFSWKIKGSVEAAHYYSMWGSSSTNIYAVGEQGYMMNYDGEDWLDVTSNTNERLNSIWGSSSSDIYAVGENGTILYYNGSLWSLVNVGGTTENLNAVWVGNSSQVFVAGDNGLILHFNGVDWTTMNSNSTENIYSLWGNSSNNVYAAGANGLILHYNGNEWKEMNSGTTVKLNSIRGISSSSIFIAGDESTIIHFDGSTWSKMHTEVSSSDFRAIWADSESLFVLVIPEAEFHYVLRFYPEVIPKLEGGVCSGPVALYCNSSEIFGDTSKGKITLDSSGNPVFDTYTTSDSTVILDNSGKENFFRLDNPVNGEITIKVKPHSGNINLMVLSGDSTNIGCNPGGCMEISTQDGTQTKEVTFKGEQGKSYYLIVDSKPNETSSYYIHAECKK
jgi:cysteine-rich repeat protein